MLEKGFEGELNAGQAELLVRKHEKRVAEAQATKLEKISKVESLRKPDKELTLRSKNASALS